jgi:putative ABC transport system permease protein
VVEIPDNSSIRFDFIVPFSKFYDGRTGPDFILTAGNFNQKTFVDKIEMLGREHPQFKESKISLIALNDIYFNTELAINTSVFSRKGNKKNLNVLIIIMFVILTISLLNFSNLQVVNVNRSFKKEAINKVSGGSNTHLLFRKIVELFLIISISSLFVSVAYLIILPHFNQYVNVELSPSILKILLLNLSVLVLMGLLAFIYPLIITLKIPVIASLKNQYGTKNQLTGKNAIVIVQYCLTIILIVSSVVVVKQLNLMLSKDLGFNTKNIVKTRLFFSPKPGPDFYKNWRQLSKEERTEKMNALNID